MYTFRATKQRPVSPRIEAALPIAETEMRTQYINQARYGEYIARFRGSLITLFGEPATTGGDDDFEYLIEATDSNGNLWFMTACSGSSGPYIGGDVRNRSLYPVAQKLIEHIESTNPSDFEFQTYDADTNSSVVYGCKDGQCYWRE